MSIVADRSHRGISPFAVVVFALAAGGAALAARQPPLPSARDVMARHATAIGGHKVFDRIRSIHAHGTLSIAAQGIQGTVDIMSARPARLLYRATVKGIGAIERGYDGTTGWSIDPVAGPELLTGRMLSELADDAVFDAALHTEDQIKDATTVGRATFDGRPAYQIKIVFASGNEETQYFDTVTNLEIGSEASEATPQGVIPTVNILRGYRKFGSLLQPSVVLQRALGFEQDVMVTGVDYDHVPDSAFDPPAEIKALLTK